MPMDAAATGLAASIVSLLVGVLAILLSALFFAWTTASETRAKVALSKVETLVSEINARTFGLLKDTWGDISRHAWPVPGNDNEPRLEKLRAELKQEINGITEALVRRDAQVEEIESKLDGLVDTAIDRVTQVEVDQASDAILKAMQLHGELEAVRLHVTSGVEFDRFFDVLEELKRRRLITYKDPIEPDTLIRYRGKSHSEAAAASDGRTS